jgi:signal transduction histidine kinase
MSFHVVSAIVHLIPALVWGIVAENMWQLRRELGLRVPLYRIAPLLAAVVATHHVLHALIALTPTQLGGSAPQLHAALETLIHVTVVATVALFRHLIRILAVPDRVPDRRWLGLNYGSAVAVMAVTLPWLLGVHPDGVRLDNPHTIPIAYAFVMAALTLREAYGLARRGTWTPGPAVSELRSADIILMATALGAMLTLLLALALTGGAPLTSVGGLALHTIVELALAAPFVARMLGRTVRAFLLATILMSATAVVYFAARVLGARAGNTELARLIDVGAVAVLLLVLGPGRILLRDLIERTIFRRSRQRQAELQAFMQSLSPELGARECCRRALVELRRVLGLRGAALVLRDGTAFVDGTFRIDAITAVWPTNAAADALPDRAFSEGEMGRALPTAIREAMIEAEVVWTIPIVTPRRRWGWVLATEGLLSTPSSTEDLEEVSGFIAHLAVVLDAAELLARTVAVERSLAHAEKLAAIGETAARIAHDIRNPVAAARSLAQQLAREPGAPFSEELEVILGELARVEERVAALLRFARREELRLERVDLAELARATADAFRPRLDAAAIGVAVDVEARVSARADREKVRQVLVNLIENAIDVLADRAGPRQVVIAVGGRNGSAAVRVADTGPGVAPDALPRLFEPFFSLKPHGTGLGLAIAKRTIDAHGGRIDVRSTPGEGTTFEIELPLAS